LTDVTPDQPINTGDSRFMVKLLQAIIRHENGIQPYGFDVFVRALDLVG
ncbi:structural protein, partial [Salmonella enterica subsp. enterica serovar Newport]|nr:structural protein [Salmonella enterica subsp. enterica serovar Newport]